ncbi:Multidrug resistance-associated protein [Blattamonas nauphoetae]|uniref:Multidrug resistance-associated protein n=1 Tax=Blattamonas nauphoetae TaxID=2049346 RepID=A0ABQ9YBY8_9EUKA|nr:Multidrug resistance-associated protein [Blattamonas nauphoetae]
MHNDIISNIDSQEFKNLATEDIDSVRRFAENLTELLMLPLKMYLCFSTARTLFDGTIKWALVTALITLPFPTLLASGSGSISWKIHNKRRKQLQKEVKNLETNIKTIKINAWEEAVHKRILDAFDKMVGDSSEDVSSNIEDFLTYIQDGLIVTSLFIENSLRGIPLDALSVRPTLASINTLTSDLMSVFSYIKDIKTCFSAVSRLEAYLNAAEMKNTHEIDGRQCVLLGDDWRTMSPAEKKKKVGEYADDVAVDMQECILGYRLKKGENGQQDQSLSDPTKTSNLTEPGDDEGELSHSEDDGSDDSESDTSDHSDNQSLKPEGDTLPSIPKRLLFLLWNILKKFVKQYIEDNDWSSDRASVDTSQLELSSLDFVPLLGRADVNTSTPSFQGRFSSRSPTPTVPQLRRSSPPPLFAPSAPLSHPHPPPPLIGPSLPRHPSPPPAPAPVMAGPRGLSHRTPSPSAVSRNTLRSPFLSPVSFTLTLKHGEHCALVGTVGCGKSLLLSTLAGQNDMWGGRGFVGGQAVFMPQDPVVLDTSLRSNILFGSELDETRLERVVRACCLDTDVKAMPDGLNTFVGEHGRKLSGGQKQRMCLARVCYSILMQREADSNTHSDDDSESNPKRAGEGHSGMRRVVLLDDPTSACDVRVAREIEENVLRGILKDETVLLATHNLPLASRFGRVVEIVEGRLERVEMVREEGKGGGEGDLDANEATDEKGPKDENEEEEENDADGQDNEITRNEDEEEEKAKLNLKTIKFLLKHFSIGLFVVSYVLSFAVNLLEVKQDSLLEEGSAVPTIHSAPSPPHAVDEAGGSEEGAETGSTAQPARVITLHTIVSYFLVSVLKALANTADSEISHRLTNQNQHQIVSGLLTILLDTPLHVFQTQHGLEWRLTHQIRALTNPRQNPLFSLIKQAQPIIVDAVAIFVKASSFMRMCLLLLVVSVVREIFRMVNRKRREEERDKRFKEERKNSPDTSSDYYILDNVLSAAPAIRQMGRDEMFFAMVAEATDRVDFKNFYSSWKDPVASMLDDALDWLLYFVIWYFGAKVKRETGKGVPLQFLYSSSVSLLHVGENLYYTFDSIKDSVFDVNSVMKVYDLPQENEHLEGEREEEAKSVEWVKEGSIEFEDVSAKYQTKGDIVLKDVSLRVERGSRVGVVGRTGCGKSTLLLTLLNMTIIEKGVVRVGGKRIDEINTRTLRGNIGVVQQEVRLANGTIRDCIDPYGQHSNDAILGALEAVGMANDVESLPLGLLTELTDTTRLLSAGQRQLLGIARALLRSVGIVVLDEPSSNVDEWTDGMVQGVMASAWREATVIVVAHRLSTVADTDVTVVMDEGRVVEVGRTRDLLNREGSELQRLALNSGRDFLHSLQEIAERVEEGRRTEQSVDEELHL